MSGMSVDHPIRHREFLSSPSPSISDAESSDDEIRHDGSDSEASEVSHKLRHKDSSGDKPAAKHLQVHEASAFNMAKNVSDSGLLPSRRASNVLGTKRATFGCVVAISQRELVGQTHRRHLHRKSPDLPVLSDMAVGQPSIYLWQFEEEGSF